MRDERRTHLREQLYYLVKYKDHHGHEGVVSSVNIGAGGVLLRIREKLEALKPISLSINFLDHPNRIISVEAEVIWQHKYQNYYKTAVRFKSINEADKKAIEDFVKYLSEEWKS